MDEQSHRRRIRAEMCMKMLNLITATPACDNCGLDEVGEVPNEPAVGSPAHANSGSKRSQ